MSTRSGVFLVPLSAERLDAARGGRSYLEVARAAGCSPGFLCQLCTGSHRNVSPALAGAIEDALHVERGTLFRLGPEDDVLLRPYRRGEQP